MFRQHSRLVPIHVNLSCESDEAIFGGAQLILEHGWLVLCVTNGDNKVRQGIYESHE